MGDRESGSPVQGHVAPGFEGVAAAFAANFAADGEVGAAFAAVLDGKAVVDLWGGMAAPGKPWAADTLQVIFSGTKGLMATCLLILVERGSLDLDAPVVRYWPEFGANGKADIRVSDIVAHHAGLPGITEVELTADELADPVRMAALLAAQPLPADRRAFACYHALTIGWLGDALIRRIDGRSTGAFFADEIARPLGLDIFIGLPAALEERVGRLERAPAFHEWDFGLTPEQAAEPVRRSIWANPPLFPPDLPWNGRHLHAAEVAAGGGIATARSVARLYGALARGGEVDGVRLLRPETLEAGRRERARFLEPFLSEPMVFGTVYQLQNEIASFGPEPVAFGHGGAGGSIHGAWPERKTGFSYVMNQMRNDGTDTRAGSLLSTLHAALG